MIARLRLRNLRRAALASAVALSLTTTLSAATLTWDPALTPVTPGGGPGTWNVSTANWSNGAADVAWVNGNIDSAVFGATVGTGAVSVAAPVVVGDITFNVGGYTLASSATANTLTFGNGTTVINTVTGSATINTVTAGATLLQVTGAGILNITNTANTFTGNIEIGSGATLRVEGQNGAAGDPTRLGAGSKTITLNGGTYISHTTKLNPTSSNTKSWIIGPAGGTIQADAEIQFDDANQFGGTGILTKTGTGLLQLNQPFLGYTGSAVNINAGTLRATNAGALGNTATTLNIGAAGILDLSGNFSVDATSGNKPVVFTANGGQLINSTTTATVLDDGVKLSANAIINNTGNLTINALDGDGGTRTLTKNGNGTLILQQNGTNFVGTTTASATGGILQIDTPGVFGTTVNLATSGDDTTIRQTGAVAAGSVYSPGFNSILSGDAAFMNSLSIAGGTLTAWPRTVGQLTAGFNQNLASTLGFANDQSRFFGIGATITESVTVGEGTPWGGISNDRFAARVFSDGTITANSSFLIRAPANTLTLGNNSANTFDIVAGTNGRRDAFIFGTVPMVGGSNAAPTANFSGLNRFVISSGGTLQPNAGNAFGGVGGSAIPVVEVYGGGTLDPGSAASSTTPGQGSINTNVTVRNRGRILINDLNNMNGSGAIRVDAGGIIHTGGNVGIFGSQTLANASNGAVYRMEVSNVTNFNTNSNPAGVFVVMNGDRSQTAGITLNAGSVPTGFASGMLTNDDSARVFTAGGNLNIGPNGGNISSGVGLTFTIAQAITPAAGSGPTTLTFGSYTTPDPLDANTIRTGTVALNAANDTTFGTSGDYIANINVRGGSVLVNSVAGSISQLGLSAARDYSLGGTLRLLNSATGSANSSTMGNLSTVGGGILHLSTGTTTPQNIQVTLGDGTAGTGTITRNGSAFAPNNRGTLGFLTDVNTRIIGGSAEQVKFANAADAPAKISVINTTGGSVALDMIAPWMYAMGRTGDNTNTSSFLTNDADVVNVGLKPVTYVSMPAVGTSTGTEIVGITGATTLPAGTTTIAALRQSAAISGNTLRLTSGGIIAAGAGGAFTNSSAIQFVTGNGVATNVNDAVEGLIINNSNQTITFTGAITALNGLTKSGPNSVTLNNVANNFGDAGLVINQANLRAGALDGFGRINNVSTKVIVNHGGNLDLAGVGTRIRGLMGEGMASNTSGTANTLTIDTIAGDSFVFDGVIRNDVGAFNLTKTGLGTQVLNGNLAYTGATTVTGGTLVVNGVSTNTSSYSVGAAGTLGGSGSILGALAVDGTLAPGNSAGMLTVLNNVTMTSTATYAVELNGTAFDLYNQPNSFLIDYDRLNVNGTVALGNATLNVSLGFTPALGDTFFIIDNDQIDAVTGTFLGLAEGSTLNVGSTQFTIYYSADTYSGALTAGNDVALVVTASAIPEPSTWALAAAGLGGWLLRRRRQKVAADTAT